MNSWRVFSLLVGLGLRLYLRIPAAMFWIMGFPAVMLLGMGTVFGGKADTEVKLVWAQPVPGIASDDVLRKSLEEAGLTIEVLPPAEAEDRWRRGKLPAMLEGADGKVRLRINSYLLIQGRQIESMAQQGFLAAQAQARGVESPARIPVALESPSGHPLGSYAAFLLPGLLGLNLLMMGVFSTGIVDVTMREKGGYKRLATTPVPRHVYLAAQVCSRMIILLASGALLMGVGVLAFGVRNQGSYAALVAVLVLGSACFLSMGYFLGSLARTVETYGGIANLVFLPLMLLSGVYFTLDSAPRWLQRGAELLPLAPLLRILRGIINDGASLWGMGTELAIVGGWTLALFVLASRRFRWI